jgi:hypothetical protein
MPGLELTDTNSPPRITAQADSITPLREARARRTAEREVGIDYSGQTALAV